jgi:hypothetical protein
LLSPTARKAGKPTIKTFFKNLNKSLFKSS